MTITAPTSKNQFGPWNAACLSKQQIRPYFVCRQTENVHWEQLRYTSGEMVRFERMADAQSCADAANRGDTPGECPSFFVEIVDGSYDTN